MPAAESCVDAFDVILMPSQGSYLFEEAPQRLLDALLASSRVETYMPNVDIIAVRGKEGGGGL